MAHGHKINCDESWQPGHYRRLRFMATMRGSAPPARRQRIEDDLTDILVYLAIIQSAEVAMREYDVSYAAEDAKLPRNAMLSGWLRRPSVEK